MSINDATNVMKQKGGIKDEKYSTENHLVFNNVMVAGRESIFITLDFYKGQLFDINVFFMSILDPKTQELFDNIKGDIEGKYGKSQCIRTFRGIYKDGDGFEMQAIKTGNADVACFWMGFSGGNTILMTITPTLAIKLNYQNASMAEEQINETKTKNSSDL